MMHSRITIVMLLCATSVAAQQRQQQRTPDTDQTVPVARGARLTVQNLAGEVVIRTEQRDTLRVAARHASRMKVEISTTPAGVTVQAHGGGSSQSVDYEITVPVWMPVKVNGVYTFISVEGTAGEVSAETVRGDIVIKGGTGFVTARSIEGEVIVEGSKGRVTVSSVNEGIQVRNAGGDISAETTNGDISLSGIDAQSVEATTVNGDIVYEGSFGKGGRYRFATHNGDITLGLPEQTSATFTVRTYNGEFESSFGLKPSGEVRRGRAATYVMGSGTAEVELESFGGDVEIRRAGTLKRSDDRSRERNREHPPQFAARTLLDRPPAAGVCHPAAFNVC
jgi:DUF4097 and DUF4098 domain-containing protein YvlB